MQSRTVSSNIKHVQGCSEVQVDHVVLYNTATDCGYEAVWCIYAVVILRFYPWYTDRLFIIYVGKE